MYSVSVSLKYFNIDRCVLSEIDTIHLIRNTDIDRSNKITKFIKWNTSTLKDRIIGPFSTDIITVFL